MRDSSRWVLRNAHCCTMLRTEQLAAAHTPSEAFHALLNTVQYHVQCCAGRGGCIILCICAVLKATSAHTFCSVSVARTPSVAFQVVVALVVLLLADPEIARGAVQCCALRNAALGCKTARVAVAHWENTHILHTHLGTCYQRAIVDTVTRSRAFVDTVTCYVDTALTL